MLSAVIVVESFVAASANAKVATENGFFAPITSASAYSSNGTFQRVLTF